jgi:hypothetical protein
LSTSVSTAPKLRRRIATLLLFSLTAVACLVLLGLIVMTVRLFEIQGDLGKLRDSALPRLVKLSQLSQEASASISIAPAMSAKPTRFEFETLLSRITDKETSQRALIQQLGGLIRDQAAAKVLQENGDLLFTNLHTLTDVVREQIDVGKRMEEHVEYFRRLAKRLEVSEGAAESTGGSAQGESPAEVVRISALARGVVFQILSTLLDPNRARFSRNRKEIDNGIGELSLALEAGPEQIPGEGPLATAQGLIVYWAGESATIYSDKTANLSNDFKIKALVEENALIANRLLSSANREFWRASAELETQIQLVDATTRFTLISILIVIVAFGAGNFYVWFILRYRVFKRLDRIRNALQAFAESGDRSHADTRADEIGVISGSLIHYRSTIRSSAASRRSRWRAAARS